MEQVLKRLIDTDEIEDEWGVSKEVQEKLRRDNAFCPWLRIGRRIYVVREEWEHWLDEQKAKAAAPPLAPAPEADDTADEWRWDGGGNDAA